MNTIIIAMNNAYTNYTVLMEVAKLVCRNLGFTLKPEQCEIICSFISGKDVFGVLPTGFGKSLCYQCLPLIFDKLTTDGLQSIILVISPLIAIMKDQVS